MGRRRSHRSIIAGVSALAISAGTVLAQTDAGTPGLQMTLDVLQSFTAGDNVSRRTNPTGSGIISRTDLTFGVVSETRADTLSLDVGARLEFGDLPDEGGFISDVVNPFAAIAYEREGPGSSFTFSLESRETQLRDSILTVIDLTTLETIDLVIDAGTRTNNRLQFGFTAGEDGPLEVKANLDMRQRRYDSTNTSLVETDWLRFNTQLTMAATRNTDVFLRGVYTTEDRDDTAQTETDSNRLILGVETEVSEATFLRMTLGRSEIEVEEGTGTSRTKQTYEGAIGSVELRHTVPNGRYSARLVQEHRRTGTQHSLRFRRELALPSGSLDASVGIRRNSSGKTNPVFGLEYTHSFKRAALSARIEQTGSTNASGADFINSRASMRYVQELSALSTLDLRVSLTDVDEISSTGADETQRLTASIAYNRALTEDWALSAGYRYETQETNGSTTLDSNEIFANFSRTFDLRP